MISESCTSNTCTPGYRTLSKEVYQLHQLSSSMSSSSFMYFSCTAATVDCYIKGKTEFSIHSNKIFFSYLLPRWREKKIHSDYKQYEKTRISVIIPIYRANCNLAKFNGTCFYASKYVPVALVYQLY